MAILTLALKGEYFDAIKSGVKVEEYRLVTPYWQQRLVNRSYDAIELTRGYPRCDDEARRLRLPWRGFRVTTITHPHFGPDPVEVFAIAVGNMTKPVVDWAQAPAGTTHVMRRPGANGVCWIKIDGPHDAFWRRPNNRGWYRASESPALLLSKPDIEPRPAEA